jgi:hypothetical protein
VQLTLALLEQSARPATPGVALDPEARAKAIDILASIIAQTSIVGGVPGHQFE